MPSPSPSGRSTFLVGGARSGKSTIAQRLAGATAAALGGSVTVLVTADVELATATGDTELLQRIARHQTDRPGGWCTVEAGHDLPAALEQVSGTALVDCVTLWLSALLPDDPASGVDAAEVEIGRLAVAVAARPDPTVVVSNEVGQGLVPATPLGRAFRDLQGRANQAVAAACDRSFLVVAGRLVPLIDPAAALEELT